RQTVGVRLGELVVLHAEAPVRIAGREPAVRRDLVQLLGVEHLEDGLEEVEAVRARVALDLPARRLQLGRETRPDHRPVPRNSLIESRTPSRSGMSDVMMRSSFGKARSRSFLNWPLP